MDKDANKYLIKSDIYHIAIHNVYGGNRVHNCQIILWYRVGQYLIPYKVDFLS
jgi:hypothetical protein